MSDPTNTKPDADEAPQEVWDEIDSYVDEYEKSLRKGLDEYFGRKPDQPKKD